MAKFLNFLIISIIFTHSAFCAHKVIQLQMLFRHGARAPDETFPTDPHAINFPSGFDQMTEKGIVEEYNLGVFVAQLDEISDFLKSLHPIIHQFSIRSTGRKRTRHCSKLVSAGLLHGHEETKSLHLIPTELFLDPENFLPLKEDLLLKTSSHCPEWRSGFDTALNEVMDTFTDIHFSYLKLVSDLMGYTDTPSLIVSHDERPARTQVRLLLKRAWRLYDSLYSWAHHNLSCALAEPLLDDPAAALFPHPPRRRHQQLATPTPSPNVANEHEGHANAIEQEKHERDPGTACEPKLLLALYQLKFAARQATQRMIYIRGGGILQRFLHNAVQRARIDSHRPDLYRDIFADDLNRPLEPIRPIHIYSAHDSTLLNLLCAIGFYDCNFATAAALDFHFVIPPFSSAVLVELVKPADEDTPAAANTSAESSYSIRFSYKPGNVDERIPIAIPGCKTPSTDEKDGERWECPLEVALRSLAPRLPGDLRVACGLIGVSGIHLDLGKSEREQPAAAAGSASPASNASGWAYAEGGDDGSGDAASRMREAAHSLVDQVTDLLSSNATVTVIVGLLLLCVVFIICSPHARRKIKLI